MNRCLNWQNSHILYTRAKLKGTAMHFQINVNNWAASWQNQQNGICAQRRLRSTWATWSESSLSAWRKLRSLATNWAHSEDSDQTEWMPRLIWIFAGRICYFVGFVMRRLNFVFSGFPIVLYKGSANPVETLQSLHCLLWNTNSSVK